MKVELDGRSLQVEDVVRIAQRQANATLAESSLDAVTRSRAVVDEVQACGAPIYGVNTGVGSQKASTVELAQIEAFNRRLLRAHSTIATDATLPRTVVRAAAVIQLNQMLSGAAGVRRELVVGLLDRLEDDALPELSDGASVGASDIVALSQLSAPLEDRIGPLHAKEALSLMSMNAVGLGRASLALDQGWRTLREANVALALALEGFRGHPAPFSEPVALASGRRGQTEVSSTLRTLLAGSGLHEPDGPRNLQDPLSFRCAPTLHGAACEVLGWAEQVLDVELNAVQVNPLVAGGALIPHGNMEPTLPTLALDGVRAVLVEVASTSAERLHKLHWPAFSGLPSGLNAEDSAQGGVQFLNLGHIAEAHAIRARSHARPVLGLYRGQLADGIEDRGAPLSLSAAETSRAAAAARDVIALEAIVAVWAIRRRGLDVGAIGAGLREVFERVVAELPIGSEGDSVFDARPAMRSYRKAVA